MVEVPVLLIRTAKRAGAIIGVVTVITIASLFIAALNLSPSQQVTSQPAASQKAIAIIGIDGGDWDTIDKLIKAGRLPTMATLKRAGTFGVMRPEPPLLSPIIWTTIATGRRPEDHGVLDFMVDLTGGGQAPVSGGARQTKALWEIFSEANRPVLVAGWWATWPADHVLGAVISDRVAAPHVHLQSDDAALVFPPTRRRDVDAVHVRPETIDYATLNRFVPVTADEFNEAVASDRASVGRLYRNRFAHLRAALAATRTYRGATSKLVPAIRPSLVAVYYELVDTTSHLFVGDARRRDAAIASAYDEMDSAIADLGHVLDPDALVLVMSDHGFFPAGAGIAEDPSDLAAGAAAWHRPYGIVAAATAGVLTGARSARKLEPLGDVSPLDIAPTVLARAGLPVAEDMPGRILSPLADRTNVVKIASYGAHRRPEQAAQSPAESLTASELERLRALGYVTGSSATSLAKVNLGEILFRKGDLRGAVRELEAAVRADPLNQRAALWLARAYISFARPDDAARVYERLLQLASTGHEIDPIVILAATDLDLRRGMQARAADRLARLPSALAGRPDALIARAAVADAQGQREKAERSLRSALTAEPANIEALSRLVDVLLKAGRTDTAAQVASDSARRFPDSAERRALAGETALAERRYDRAARAFEVALMLAPDTLSVRVELARVELLQNRADLALATLRGVDGSREVETIRGAAYSNRGDWAAAAQAYGRAVAIGPPPTVDLLNALGNAQLEAGRPAEAVATLERSLSLKADQPSIRALVERARGRSRRPPPS